uniref:CG11148 n=1 Tax=Macrostomum lignano TaxID=282301 RepID=A0A1I8JRP0_9PLAT
WIAVETEMYSDDEFQCYGQESVKRPLHLPQQPASSYRYGYGGELRQGDDQVIDDTDPELSSSNGTAPDLAESSAARYELPARSHQRYTDYTRHQHHHQHVQIQHQGRQGSTSSSNEILKLSDNSEGGSGGEPLLLQIGHSTDDSNSHRCWPRSHSSAAAAAAETPGPAVRQISSRQPTAAGQLSQSKRQQRQRRGCHGVRGGRQFMRRARKHPTVDRIVTLLQDKRIDDDPIGADPGPAAASAQENSQHVNRLTDFNRLAYSDDSSSRAADSSELNTVFERGKRRRGNCCATKVPVWFVQ